MHARTHALTLSLSLPSGSSHYRCVSINSAAGGVRRETDRPNSAFLSIHLRPLFSAFFCFVGSLDVVVVVVAIDVNVVVVVAVAVAVVVNVCRLLRF